jgi:hypothetical protein
MSCKLKPFSLSLSLESITQSSLQRFAQPILSFTTYAKLMERIHNNYFQVKLLKENFGFNTCTNKDV